MYRALLTCLSVFLPAALCSAAPPTTQPISQSSILVLPIEPPGGTYGWVGRAIQQDMLVDLTQMTRAKVMAPSGSPAADPDAAVRAGRDANANYVVFGAAQNSGSQLRVTGQVIDVATGQTLGNLKATAPADDLFPLEDALAVQVARSLPGVRVPTTAPAVSTAQPLPRVINEPPYVSEATPAPQYESVPESDYGPTVYEPYPYTYPGYYYPGYVGLGWWGPGVIIEGHHFHDGFDHGFHGGFDRGFGRGFDHRGLVSPHVNPGLYNRSLGHSGFRSSPGFGGARGGLGGGFGGSHGGFSGGGGGGGHGGGGGGHGR